MRVSSIFLRSRITWTSTVRSNPSTSGPCRSLQQLEPGEDAARLAGQGREQAELGGGEGHPPVRRGAPRARPDRPRAVPRPRPADPHRGIVSEPAHPAQDRPYARHELAGGERLDEVVVGPEGEAAQAVRLTRLRRQHEDRHRGVAAERGAHLLARQVGEHQIQHDEVRCLGRHRVEGTSAGGRRPDLETVAAQIRRSDLDDPGFVIDDEDRTAHAGTRPGPLAGKRYVSRVGTTARASAASVRSPSPAPR